MGRNHGIQAGVRALSDATGLSPEEVWLTATAVALAAALAGLILNIDVVTDVYAELKRPGFDV